MLKKSRQPPNFRRKSEKGLARRRNNAIKLGEFPGKQLSFQLIKRPPMDTGRTLSYTLNFS